MQNKVNERGTRLTLPVPAAANSGVGPNAGDPLLFGNNSSPNFGLAGVVINNYTPPTGVPTGNVGVDFEGVFALSVVAKSSIGGSSLAINPGDRIYADGGTRDVTTGCVYGCTLNANSSTGAYFGNAIDALAAGSTGTIRVRLKGNG